MGLNQRWEGDVQPLLNFPERKNYFKANRVNAYNNYSGSLEGLTMSEGLKDSTRARRCMSYKQP